MEPISDDMASPVEVPRREVGEDDSAYLRRVADALLVARLRVVHSRIDRTDSTMSTLLSEVDGLHDQVTEARSRTDRLVESVGAAEARILHAISAEKGRSNEACRAMAAGMGDAVRAVAASSVLSIGLVVVAALLVVVLGAWLLDLAPSMTTDYGSVSFAPKPASYAPVPVP
jgi:hypothetical protein